MSPELIAPIQAPPADMPADWQDYLPSALAVLALDGTVRAINRAALKLLNFDSSQVIGRHFTHFLRSTEPPLLQGGFDGLLALGKATFDVDVRCGGDRFLQVEIQMIVVYDARANASGVLVMSSEGDAENILLRRALAKVADEVSRTIAFSARDESVWSNIFAICQNLFEMPGGWLMLRDDRGAPSFPIVFGPWQQELHETIQGKGIQDCPCYEATCLSTDCCASNSLDCPWLTTVRNLVPGIAHETADMAGDLAGDEIDQTTPIFRHHAVAPILYATGERAGALCLLTPAGRIYRRRELMLMDAITDQIGQALDRGELHLPKYTGGVDRLWLADKEIASPELAEVFDQILVNLAAMVPLASAGIFLQEKDGLLLVAAVNHPEAQDLRGQHYPFAGNLLHEEIIRSQSLIILEDVRKDARFELWGGLEYIRGWMGLPLVVNGKSIGVITVDSDQVGGFSRRDGEMAQAFAAQAAIAVEKARLAMELSADKQNLELLYRLSQSLAATLNLQSVAENALELITAAFDDCSGEIYVAKRGEEFLQLLATKNHSPQVVAKLPGQPYLRPGVGVVGAAIDMRRPVLVPNVHEDPRWIWIPDLNLVIRSVAAIPLMARNEMVGALVLGSSKLNTFNYAHRSLLQSIAFPVALALQNARLFAAERKGHQEAEMLHNATSAVTLELRLEQILHILLERLQRVVPYDSACVLLLRGKELCAVAERGLPNAEEVIGKTFPANNPFFARIQREEKTLVVDDMQNHPWFSGWGGTSTTRGWMGVPLLHRGEMLGYITLDSLQTGSYGEREASLAQAFANQVAVTLVNAHLLQDSQRAASEQQEVSKMMRGLNGATSLAEIQKIVALGMHRLIGPAAIEIGLYQADEQQVHAVRSVWADESETVQHTAHSYHFDESAAIHSLRKGQSHISADIDPVAQLPVDQMWAGQGYRSYIALPLQAHNHILGHIQLLWHDRMEPHQSIHHLLPQVADGLAMSAEKIELLQQTNRRADELTKLIELSSALRRVEGRAQIIDTLLSNALQIFRADRGYVFAPNASEEYLEMIAHAGLVEYIPEIRFGYTDSVAGRVFTTGQPYRSTNLVSDSLAHQPTLHSLEKEGIRFISAIFAPLRRKEEVVGVLAIINAETNRSFSQADLRLFTAIAEVAGTALHRTMILEGLEQRVAERTADLAQANLRLLELDQLKSDFVTNVSHELRTPLTNIKLHLELLARGRPERREHYMQVVQNEAEQLHTLIESILQLSALDAWNTPTEKFTVVSLHEVTEAIFDRFQEQARAAGLDFVYQPGPLPLFIQGSLEHLQQLTVNLITNAIHYTPAGGRVELALETKRRPEAGAQEAGAQEAGVLEAGIVVRDTGVGIPADEIPLIFDRFYRGKRIRDAQISGTGLGLSIVKDIAQAHRGRVEVKSVPNVGTTFSVWFPQAKMEQAGQ